MDQCIWIHSISQTFSLNHMRFLFSWSLMCTLMSFTCNLLFNKWVVQGTLILLATSLLRHVSTSSLRWKILCKKSSLGISTPSILSLFELSRRCIYQMLLLTFHWFIVISITSIAACPHSFSWVILMVVSTLSDLEFVRDLSALTYILVKSLYLMILKLNTLETLYY